MRRLHNTLATLAVTVGLAVSSMGCAGMAARENLMPIMGIAWATQVTPLILEEVEDLPQVEQQAILSVAQRMQSLLDSGDVSTVLDVNELWLLLKPVAESAIESRVANGELGPNGALLLHEMLRQFEMNLARLVVSSGS